MNTKQISSILVYFILCHYSFKVNDVALFLPTRNSTGKPWAAFNIHAPHYFLKPTDRVSDQLATREWIVARIASMTECVVDSKVIMMSSLLFACLLQTDQLYLESKTVKLNRILNLCRHRTQIRMVWPTGSSSTSSKVSPGPIKPTRARATVRRPRGTTRSYHRHPPLPSNALALTPTS